jgi:hypothetical protein
MNSTHTLSDVLGDLKQYVLEPPTGLAPARLPHVIGSKGSLQFRNRRSRNEKRDTENR